MNERASGYTSKLDYQGQAELEAGATKLAIGALTGNVLGARRRAIEEIFEEGRVRYRYGVSDDFLNGSNKIITGPSCGDLFPILAQDSYEYSAPLRDIELREIIASTTLAVLDDAEVYTTIVGEDTSGRIPALIIGKAMNIVRQQKSLPPARRLFMSGRIAEGLSPDFGPTGQDDKALLVTECIQTGTSANGALNALRLGGFVEPSIVALDRSPKYDGCVDTKTFYMGDRSTYTGAALGHLHYNRLSNVKGVTKKIGHAHADRAAIPVQYRQQLVQSRHDFDHFAQQIVDIWHNYGNS